VSAAGFRDRPRGLWEVLTWPVGPVFIVGRGTSRPGARSIIAASSLPEELKVGVLKVVRRTRLWSPEQADVSRELVAHFADALEAGATPERALRDFGDPARAARMIRRAKIRNRPLAWQAWVRVWQGIGVFAAALLVAYGALAARYWTGSPELSRNYVGEVNARALASPEPDRAWPLYKRAILASVAQPPGFYEGVDWHVLSPSHPRWGEVVTYLRAIEPTLELTRAAAERPVFGMPLVDSGDPDVHAHTYKRFGDPDLVYRPEKPRENPPLFELLIPELSEMRRLARNLQADARVAAAEKDGARVVADVRAIVGIAEHLMQPPLPILSLVGLTAFGGAVRTTGDILRDDPGALSDSQITALAHTLASFRGGGPLQPDLDHTLLFRDVLQRVYTDDNGDGRLTPEGLRFLTRYETVDSGDYPRGRRYVPPWGFALWGMPHTTYRDRLMDVGGPVLGATMTGRRDAESEFRRVLEFYRQEQSLPSWERTSAADRELLSLMVSEEWRGRYWPVAVMLPAYGAFIAAGESATMRRDAVLVALALELWRRGHGGYPEFLEHLTPRYLPAVPPDRFDGSPLRYLLEGGRPVLYSVGADRKDHGGVPPAEPVHDLVVQDFRIPRDRAGTIAQGDWVLWGRQ
jgi:hypothetical protein